MKALYRTLSGLALLLVATTASVAADRTIIVLDASGSMWGQIDGKPKLEIARESLRSVLQAVPGDQEIGFMAYGHREKGSCDDIELIVPPAAGGASAISIAADNLKFLGKTPLTAAVKQAAEALKYTEDKARVILITDGLETCKGDPCALGTELKASGVDFTADVVGFGLTAEEGKQVACLAENTGGKYIQASDAKALQDALAETVAAPAPEPEPAPAPKAEFNIIPSLKLAEGGPFVDADGGQTWEFYKREADGSRGEHVRTEYYDWRGNLEPGDYVLAVNIGRAEVEQPLTIEEGKVAEPVMVLNAGTLNVRPFGAPGQEPDDGAAILFTYPGGDTTGYGETKLVLPAGEQKVTVTIGKGAVTESFMLAAGETVSKDIVVGVGHVVANAYYAEGMKVEDGGLAVRIFKATKKIDGSREDITYGFGPDSTFELPAGDYVLVAKMQATEVEAPFTVKVGERMDVDALLNAGVLAVTAKGAKITNVFAAAKDIQGKRKSLHYSYDEEFQTTLPAGDYVIEAERGDDNAKSDISVTIKAGERSEIAVP